MEVYGCRGQNYKSIFPFLFLRLRCFIAVLVCSVAVDVQKALKCENTQASLKVEGSKSIFWTFIHNYYHYRHQRWIEENGPLNLKIYFSFRFVLILTL